MLLCSLLIVSYRAENFPNLEFISNFTIKKIFGGLYPVHYGCLFVPRDARVSAWQK
jgi:hypothetical protein